MIHCEIILSVEFEQRVAKWLTRGKSIALLLYFKKEMCLLIVHLFGYLSCCCMQEVPISSLHFKMHTLAPDKIFFWSFSVVHMKYGVD